MLLLLFIILFVFNILFFLRIRFFSISEEKGLVTRRLARTAKRNNNIIYLMLLGMIDNLNDTVDFIKKLEYDNYIIQLGVAGKFPFFYNWH